MPTNFYLNRFISETKSKR